MQIENIKYWQLDALRKSGLNLNHLHIIYIGQRDTVVSGYRDRKKLEDLAMMKNGKTTQYGTDYYYKIINMVEPEKQQKKSKSVEPVVTGLYDEQWREFWAQWPSTSNFEYMGKKFAGDRTMKSKEQVCRNKWTATVISGISPDVLLRAAGAQIEAKKKESYRSGSNQLKYLNGLEVWLNGRMWEAWMDVKMDFGQEQKIANDYQTSI